jgi:glutathione peroxidase-family protein
MSLKKMYGGEPIPLYTDTSLDWHNKNADPNYAVDLNVGVNEYTFGRTTPDNKFIVSTGLVSKPFGIEMTGGKKVKTVKKIKSVKKESSLTNKVSKFFVNAKNTVIKPFKSSPIEKSSKYKKPIKKSSTIVNNVSKFFVDAKDTVVKTFESTPVKKSTKSSKKSSSMVNNVSKFFVDAKDTVVKPFESSPVKKSTKSKKPVKKVLKKKMKGGV